MDEKQERKVAFLLGILLVCAPFAVVAWISGGWKSTAEPVEQLVSVAFAAIPACAFILLITSLSNWSAKRPPDDP
jgi:hypothetical protein